MPRVGEKQRHLPQRLWLCVAGLVLAVTLGLVFKDEIIRLNYERKRARFVSTVASSPTTSSKAQAFNKNKMTAARVFAGATKVEPYRMVHWMGSPMDEGIGKVEGFPYTAQGPTQDAAFARRLGNIILDEKSYTFVSKACSFNPTVAFRVWNGEGSVTVLICFGCNQLVILEKNAPVTNIGGISARFKVAADFDLYRPELLALAKEVFPNDKSLHKLPIYKTGLVRL